MTKRQQSWLIDCRRRRQLLPKLFLLSQANPLECKGNYSATLSNKKMKSVHWPLMAGLLHLVQRWGAWAGCSPAQSPPRCTKCNSSAINGQCTNFIFWTGRDQGTQPAQAAHRCCTVPNPSTASVPIIVLLYNGRLLCGFNVHIKGLTPISMKLGVNDLRASGYVERNLHICINYANSVKGSYKTQRTYFSWEASVTVICYLHIFCWLVVRQYDLIGWLTKYIKVN